MSEHINDQSIRQNVPVSSVPSGLHAYTAGSTVIPAGTILTFRIETIPDVLRLALWNFKRTIRVDTDDYAHRFRDGEALTTGQRKLRFIADGVDYDDSSDLLGTEMYKLSIENFDTADHTVFLRFKSYTLATITGGQAGS